VGVETLEATSEGVDLNNTEQYFYKNLSSKKENVKNNLKETSLENFTTFFHFVLEFNLTSGIK